MFTNAKKHALMDTGRILLATYVLHVIQYVQNVSGREKPTVMNVQSGVHHKIIF